MPHDDDNPNFLDSTDLAPDPEQLDASEPIDMDECENCGELAEDLYPVESGDESVGYRETRWLCEKCRPRRKP